MKKGKKILISLLCFVLIAGIAAGTYYGINKEEIKEKRELARIAKMPIPAMDANGNLCYINRQGEVVISGLANVSGDKQFTFDANGYCVIYNSDYEYGIIDKNGNWILPMSYDYLYGFDDNGRCPVKDPNTELYGVIDTSGNWVIQAKFDDIDEFSKNGLACARDSATKLYGFIDKKGEWAIQPQFEYASSFQDNGLASAVKQGDTSYTYGYIDESGNWVIQPKFESVDGAGPFGGFAENGLACVMDSTTNKLGYIDKTGEWVIQPQFVCGYDDYTFDENGLALVATSGQSQFQYGIIDSSGNYVVQPSYSSVYKRECDGETIYIAEHFRANDTALTQYTVFSESGETLFETTGWYQWYTGLSSNDLIPWQDPNTKLYGFLDLNGNWAIPAQFEYVYNFSENGLAAAENTSGLWGFIDESGNWVIQPQYESVESFDDIYDVARVWNGNNFSIIDKTGNKIYTVTVND